MVVKSINRQAFYIIDDIGKQLIDIEENKIGLPPYDGCRMLDQLIQDG